jgi:radical SAM protein with 4Fe4S-binding SPASM domain
MTLFDDNTVDFVLREGLINQVICSIDGVDKETFEYMRPNADFYAVLKNTDYLLQKNRECKEKITIHINNGRDERSAGRKIDPVLKKIFDQVDIVAGWKPLDWNESFHRECPVYSVHPYFCSFVFESVSLSTSGAIIRCCNDLREATKYGDLSRDTLRSIWFSAERLGFLRAMRAGNRHLIPGCSNCSIGYVRQNKYL